MPDKVSASISSPSTGLPLAPYRVLDLADDKGALCGRILADFGTDVIKVERPGGDRSRNTGPFYHGIPDPQKSLWWFAFNANKRGITLGLTTRDGQEILKRLIRGAHFLVESFPPGYLDNLGLGFETLQKINPGLIMVSITPFGQTGPYRDYHDCDIVHMALGGFMYVSGDTDRAPLRISIDQAYLQAGAQAAAAAMIAHYYRQNTGEGQHVDISIEEAAVCSARSSTVYWDFSKQLMRRVGNRVHRGPVSPRIMWPCKDGFVSWRIWTAQQGAATIATVDWMNSEGLGYELKGIDWRQLDYNSITQEQLEAWEERFQGFFLTHTKAELHEESVRRNLLLFPVNEVKDVAENRQLKERGFWVEVEHPELGARLTYPGAALKSSAFYYGIRFRAPLIGEHNLEIYGQELGFSREELAMLKEASAI